MSQFCLANNYAVTAPRPDLSLLNHKTANDYSGDLE